MDKFLKLNSQSICNIRYIIEAGISKSIIGNQYAFLILNDNKGLDTSRSSTYKYYQDSNKEEFLNVKRFIDEQTGLSSNGSGSNGSSFNGSSSNESSSNESSSNESNSKEITNEVKPKEESKKYDVSSYSTPKIKYSL
ncbi:MAG: hypothetical protein Homavirus21_9 [Homavirus sp.]|uniref:Uncharacterized protein n=1 Tax=Homavirus sp. TaxID=2487769 RepID=A0A3G5A5F7_9VIRU|nr:MAG: hypothetical protein Homavirus21_9 [Homavirus sp.]